jgi:predicted TIM-barrel fold metal-dependent hydrolase
MTTEREAWLALTPEDPIDADLAICDAHHHLWDRPNDRYLIDDFLKDVSGGHRIVRTVFIECRAMYRNSGPEEMRPVGETEFVQGVADQVAREQSGKMDVASGIVGYADLTLGARVEPILEAHIAASKNRFRGIRHITTWDANPAEIMATQNAPKGLLMTPKFREGFACLHKYGLSFDAWLYYPQLMDLVDLAKAFPDTTIIMNHTGGVLGIGPYAGKRDEVLRDWKRGVAALADCPNVAMKLGGLGMPRTGFGWYQMAAPPTSSELAKTMAPYYNWCIEQFGVDRCMFESNFPVDKISYSYTVMWNAFKLMSKDFSPRERNALFHDTAVKVYRLTAK